MKKIVLLLFVVFAFVSTNAQVTKDVSTATWYQCFTIPCDNVVACGDVYVTHTYWYNADGTVKKYQQRAKGEFVTSTGEVYTTSCIVNDMAWKWWYKAYFGINDQGAEPDTYIDIWVWEKDGVPVAISRMVWHMTVNANEVTTVNIALNHYDWECL